MEKLDKEALKKIVKGCVKGDRESQKLLYQSYYSKMMSVCYRYTKDADEAKDILHDGFIKIFNSLHKFKFDGSLEGWMRRLVVNTAIDNYRRNKKMYSMTETGMTEDQIDLSVEADVFSTFNAKVIMEAVQSLSPAYRTVFNLYAIEGYSHKEIAEKLGVSVGTSKSNLAKAKVNLRQQLEKKIKYKNEY